MTTLNRYAVMDFGTGSLRLTVAQVNPQGGMDVLHYKNTNHLLGEELAKNKRFSDAEMAKTIELFKSEKATADSFNPVRTVVVGTESVRGSANGRDFMAMVKAATGLDMRLLTGEEELDFSLLGSRHHVQAFGGNVLFADSGGGSTEVALIDAPTLAVKAMHSFKFGVTGLGQRLAHTDVTDAETFDALTRELHDHVRGFMTEVGHATPVEGLVLAGAPFYLIRYKLELAEELLAEYDGHIFTQAEIEDIAHKLRTLGYSGRMQHPYISPAGARWLVPAAAKCLALMRAGGVDKLVLAPSGVTKGLLHAVAEGKL
jgi:exopolyphosphatase/guanosine-5'-triphosphate,3'-diphosphate pyrophosphatase